MIFRIGRRRWGRLFVLLLFSFASTILYAEGVREGETEGGSDGTGSAIVIGPAILEHWQQVDSADAWKLVDRSGEWHLLVSEGTEVPLRPYERIVITSAGAVEILYMIGGESRIAAIGTSRDGIWPAEKTAALPAVGGLARPSLEAILSFEPDLVIANGMNTELVADLNKRGILSIIHGTDTIAEIMNAVLVLGVFSASEESAIELVAERNAALEDIRKELARKPLELKGAFIYSVSPMQAFLDASLPGQILSILGVTNIASGLKTDQPIISPEYLLAQNPDFILGAMSIANEDQILNADSVALKTRAGSEKNVWVVPSHLILRPTPRVIDALTFLHGKLSELAARE
jgi:iron complex transport system substrate-binding protein